MARLNAISALLVVGGAFGATIDISTGAGNANWQVYVASQGEIYAVSLDTAGANGSWAPAPLGASWVSWGPQQGSSCFVGQTPGVGCASALSNPLGDGWIFQLDISAVQLGYATSGTINFVFGADDRVTLFVGGGPGANAYTAQEWGQGGESAGLGYDPLGCSAPHGPTSAGDTQSSYGICPSSIAFLPGYLGSDGSLMFTAYVYNDPIPNCQQCGDPTGFVLSGNIYVPTIESPEPSTLGLLGVGLAFMMSSRRLRSLATSAAREGLSR